MATVKDIVQGGFKRVIPDSVNDPTANEEADGLTALNDMMSALVFEGIHVNWETKALTDTFPLNNEHVQGVKAMLGKRLCEDFGRGVPPQLMKDARKGQSALYKDFSIHEPRKAETALMRFSAMRRQGY